ncbi:glycosyltransferase family 2 protein [Beijerinckia indica]|uniref:Glycosyl transferase family 2 n=1 Tax=Beijerinckia indica subsp. indica (strain ATCC 9039 / DSM 1715 / NCIMB 8712) TaxID=395963 RepID=B2IH75_BEII9|nr:glycosyltransferase family 2 protein [Beijerinckia indica]ACB94488.1 glycosyl transferase family 2 [Beijerinckia indica subsp. indica ATCC 9039]
MSGTVAQEVAANTHGQLSLGVLISTYQRPESLERCLEGLAKQTRRPDDVIVVCRTSDKATCDWLAEHWPKKPEASLVPVRMVPVVAAGLVNSRNAGLAACRTDVLAIIDDDVVPCPEWLERVGEHFTRDPNLGGLGGRDHVHDGECFDERQKAPVGILQWFGRVIGNHHLGFGEARPVHILKGANMSYRARALQGLGFDTRLRGRSTQPHDDLSFSLQVGAKGWTLLYDPAVLVYHYAGRADQRAYSAISRTVKADELRDATYNMVLAIWDHLSPARRLVFLLWSFFIGTGVEPGLLQALRYTPRFGLASWQRFFATQQGKATAVADLLFRRRQDGPRRVTKGLPSSRA